MSHSTRSGGRATGDARFRPTLTDGSNSFAEHTVLKRLPSVIDDVTESNTGLSEVQRESVRRFREEVVEDRRLTMFEPPAPDWDDWQRWFGAHQERMAEVGSSAPSARNAEWFFYEHFFYRKLIAATDWWANGNDPFGAAKQRELAGEGLWRGLGQALETAQNAAPSTGSPEESAALAAVLSFSLWGNRIDLSYNEVAALGQEDTGDRWLVRNDLAELLRTLEDPSRAGRPVHIVADNGGTELAGDLAFSDHMLQESERQVYLHVKLHPTYVSDATPADVWDLVGKMRECSLGPAPELVQGLGKRLYRALQAGRLRVVPDLYWNSPEFLDTLPPRLARPFSGAALVIFKGDMNYRRLIADVVPGATVPLSSVALYVPAPVLLVRILKSDAVVGLDGEVVSALDGEDPQWRVNGRRGLMQFLSPQDASER